MKNKVDKDQVVGSIPGNFTVQPTRNRNITFQGENGEIIGELHWDDGEMHFEGNADAAAKMFFTAVKGYFENE